MLGMYPFAHCACLLLQLHTHTRITFSTNLSSETICKPDLHHPGHHSSNYDDSSTIQICIFSPMGKRIFLVLPVTASGHQVKLECLRLLGDHLRSGHDHERKIHAENYKLVKARIQFELDEHLTLNEMQIVDNGKTKRHCHPRATPQTCFLLQMNLFWCDPQQSY